MIASSIQSPAWMCGCPLVRKVRILRIIPLRRGEPDHLLLRELAGVCRFGTTARGAGEIPPDRLSAGREKPLPLKVGLASSGSGFPPLRMYAAMPRPAVPGGAALAGQSLLAARCCRDQIRLRVSPFSSNP